jgi:hypothetical protein
MKKLIIFATSYPYTAVILAVIWVGSATLLKVDDTLPLTTVLVVNSFVSIIIAAVGFRR